MRTIQANNRPDKVILVSDCDYEYLAQFKWNYRESDTGITIRRKTYRKSIVMWREIMGFPVGLDVDHRNHDRLDNRRENLRVSTRSQNQANRSLNKRGTRTNIKGVRLLRGKYEVTIGKDGKDIYVGRFDTVETAKLAYRAIAALYHGEFAYEG